MKRTELTRKSPLRNKAPIARTGKRMKSTRPKMTPIRRSAKGEACTLMIPGVCNHDPATTVLCHSNALADGKGLGLKAPDTAACYGCSACHDVLDGRRALPHWITRNELMAGFAAAVVRTHQRLREKGLM